MYRRKFLNNLSAVGFGALIPNNNLFANSSKENIYKPKDRKYWYETLNKIVYPVFFNLANGTLVKNMPVKTPLNYDGRKNVAYLEAVGRSAAGVAPWLALPDETTKEGKTRQNLTSLFLEGLSNGVNPNSPDQLNFEKERQPIIDAGHLAHGLLRAPKTLWEPLSNQTKERLIEKFKILRTRKIHKNNWLIFRAITECFLMEIGQDYKKESIDNAVKSFEEWYIGDGWFKDGVKFSFNYYNSFAMHPMLVDVLKVLVKHGLAKQETYELALKRMTRHCVSLERMISPEGTFPLIGRSITYRTGAFHALATLALMDKLPDTIPPNQVRSALTAVKKNLLVDDVFDKNGWLNLGFKGKQPDVADYYTSTGSLYMTTLSFVALGLPETHRFWSGPDEDWTTKAAWKGNSFTKDFQVQF
ncbi:DUF2264 domain-containing protein [Flagellimonas marinaquae]|uniref:DUF2264 domain-containing protein n=1 Tax=Flagellimonas aurea TaxID=2915619 RepID=UPI001CE10590|nr:DUF2264 domain-containing protein [Allomuricauda aquimarina]